MATFAAIGQCALSFRLVSTQCRLGQNQVAAQRMREGGVYFDIDHLTYQAHAVGASREVDHAVALGAARHFSGVFACGAFYQNALHRVQAAVANAFHIGFNGGL